MNKLTLHDLYELTELQVVIDSYDGAIYQASLCEEDGENLIWLDATTPLKTRSLVEMRDLLAPFNLDSLYLRQQSAYDEMVGQPLREANNTLIVPIYPDRYPDANLSGVDYQSGGYPAP